MSRLYATVTSEKASKGQGGQEYIDIEVMNSRREVVATFKVRETPPTDTDYLRTIEIWHNGVTKVLCYQDTQMSEETKGKRQKGECTECGAKVGHEYYCPERK